MVVPAASGSRRGRGPWLRWAFLLGVLGAGAVLVVYPAIRSAAVPAALLFGAPGSPTGPPVHDPASGDLPPAVMRCAHCHTLPPPHTLPRGRWPAMIQHMHGLNDTYRLGPSFSRDELRVVTGWYESRAPYALPVLPQRADPDSGGFRPTVLCAPPPPKNPGLAPRIGNLHVVDLDRDGHTDVLVCDTGEDAVNWIVHRGGRWSELRLGSVSAPARTAVADLNGDGHPDIVVASLGSIMPTEEQVGSVVVLYCGADGNFQPQPIFQNAPRVADAQPADMDGDGDLDVVVAMFGMFSTGGVGLLEQTAPGVFSPRTLLAINGVSHVPVGDINGDRRPDIVALLSQQHERVVALVNLGGGRFDPGIVYQGPHPLFGMAGLELVDLDRDGDLDMLLANGDALDKDPHPKPYHGVQWLENLGGLRFGCHDIARFYGAYCATAADLDGDGDRDIVATSMMNVWDDPNGQSVIWLENYGGQRFTVRPISSSPTFQISAAVGDLDRDGRPDIVTSGMYVLPPYHRVGRITAWVNAMRR